MLKYKKRGFYIHNAGNRYYAYRTRPKWLKKTKTKKTLPPDIYMSAVIRSGIVKDLGMGILSDP